MATNNPPAVFNSAWQCLRPAFRAVLAHRCGDHVEGLNHSQHGAHQSQQRADRCHAIKQRRYRRRPCRVRRYRSRLVRPPRRADPFPHRSGKDLGHGTAVFLAQIQGLLAVEFRLGQLLHESLDKGFGDYPAPPQVYNRSNMNVTTRNEQRARAYINGPPSLMIIPRFCMESTPPRVPPTLPFDYPDYSQPSLNFLIRPLPGQYDSPSSRKLALPAPPRSLPFDVYARELSYFTSPISQAICSPSFKRWRDVRSLQPQVIILNRVMYNDPKL